MNKDNLKSVISERLAGFTSLPLKNAATALLNTLGYASDKTIDLDGSPSTFLEHFNQHLEATGFNEQKALVDNWQEIQLLFQLTDDEISSHTSLFDNKDVRQGLMNSYLFFAIKLKGESYARGKLADITRHINRLFSMPVMVLFQYDNGVPQASSLNENVFCKQDACTTPICKQDACTTPICKQDACTTPTCSTLSIAVINRRQHKRDVDKDVLGKVTLIQDINLTNPHRGHLDIIESFSIPDLQALDRKKPINNFDALHEAWEQVFNVELLNKKFYRELSDWYFWAMQSVRFPYDQLDPDKNKDDLFKDTAKIREHDAKNLIRLLTRLLFVWFIKEKELIPAALFEESKLKKLLTQFDPESADTNYYKAILQNLFFATLNQTHGKREFRHPGQNQNTTTLLRYESRFTDPQKFIGMLEAHVPFMNGGLFECLDKPHPTLKGRQGGAKILYEDGFSDREDNTLKVPDYLFFAEEETIDLSDIYGDNKRQKEHVRGIIPLLNSYKFTIMENTPVEQEIALDPELLGKVFENLLASYNPETKTTARKQTGSFYTPRTIVDYMVDESLKAYLLNEVPQASSLNGNGVPQASSLNASGVPQASSLNAGVPQASSLNAGVPQASSLNAVPFCKQDACTTPVLNAAVFCKQDACTTPVLNAAVFCKQDACTTPVLNAAVFCKQDACTTSTPLSHRINQLFQYSDEAPPFSTAERHALIAAIDSCKILDPACGSGAFPMGVLLKLVYILSKLDPQDELWKLRQIEKVDATIAAAEQIDDADVRDNTLRELEAKKVDIQDSFENNELGYGRKLYLIENCIYGVDIQSIATQISKLRFFISLVVDQTVNRAKDNFNIRSLPNLETKFVAANTLIGIEKPDAQGMLFELTQVKALENELKKIRHELFNAKTPKTKNAKRQRDKELREAIARELETNGWESKAARLLSQWDPYDQNASSPFFDSEWMFDVRGFDIVIGNPPYARKMPASMKQAINKFYRTANYQVDLYVAFFEQGLSLLKPKGVLIYITPNSWLKNVSMKKLRKYFLEETSFRSIIPNIAGVFTANVDTSISLFVKDRSSNIVKVMQLDNGVAKLRHELDYTQFWHNYGFVFDVESSPKIRSLLHKIRENGVSVNDFFEVTRGYNPYDAATGQSQEVIENRVYHSDYKKDETFVPELKGKHVQPWGYKWDGKHYISYGDWLAAPRKLKFFQGERLLFREILGKRLVCCYIDEDFKTDRSLYIAKPREAAGCNLKAALAMLVSSLMSFYFKYSSNEFDALFPKIRVAEFKQLPLVSFIESVLMHDLVKCVEAILEKKKNHIEADVSDLETEIDQLVYKLYDLTPEEIAIVEGKV